MASHMRYNHTGALPLALLLLRSSNVVVHGGGPSSSGGSDHGLAPLQLTGLTLNRAPLLPDDDGGTATTFVAVGEDLRLSWHLECSPVQGLGDARTDERQASHRLSLRRASWPGGATAEVGAASGWAESAQVLLAPSAALQPDTRYTVQLSVITTAGRLVSTSANFSTALSPP
jgi:hypothetical protein